MRKLYFDIEVSPYLGWFFKPGYQVNLNYDNVIENAKIICICYKWDNDPKIYSLTWDKKQNDKNMLKDFLKILDQADQIIGHNSDKFDVKWIRTRCMVHDIQMMPEYTSIDTYKESKNGFYFPSNRLDAIGKYMKVGKKIKTDSALWLRAWIENDKRALNDMVKYCKQDVLLLEQVFKKLEPYIKLKTRRTSDITECGRCGSSNIGVKSYKISASGQKYVQIQCKDCGQYHKAPRLKFEKLSKLNA